MITELKQNQIFVFGSNLNGNHAGGAARQALKFGAVMGEGVGLFGQTYAIATLDKAMQKMPLSAIEFQLYVLSKEAKTNHDKEYLLTPIGTGIAGFTLEEIKSILPEFPDNVVLVGDWD